MDRWDGLCEKAGWRRVAGEVRGGQTVRKSMASLGRVRQRDESEAGAETQVKG